MYAGDRRDSYETKKQGFYINRIGCNHSNYSHIFRSNSDCGWYRGTQLPNYFKQYESADGNPGCYGSDPKYHYRCKSQRLLYLW